MDKNTIYIIMTLLKAVIIIIGMPIVILNLISWLKIKDGEKLKKAAMTFGAIFLSIIVLSGIEFIIAFK